MLTKIEHILLFTVFADFWMVCFFSTKRTVRVVTQKQFVSSIAHFNTFSFEVSFWNFDFSISKTLALMCHFFCTHSCPSSGTVTWAEVRNHDSHAHVWRHKNKTLVCQLNNGGRENKKQRRSCARPDAAHLLMSSSRLDDGTQTNAFQLSFPRSSALSTAKVINAVKHELSWNCPARGSWTACFGVRDMIRIII